MGRYHSIVSNSHHPSAPPTAAGALPSVDQQKRSRRRVDVVLVKTLTLTYDDIVPIESWIFMNISFLNCSLIRSYNFDNYLCSLGHHIRYYSIIIECWLVFNDLLAILICNSTAFRVCQRHTHEFGMFAVWSKGLWHWACSFSSPLVIFHSVHHLSPLPVWIPGDKWI